MNGGECNGVPASGRRPTVEEAERLIAAMPAARAEAVLRWVDAMESSLGGGGVPSRRGYLLQLAADGHQSLVGPFGGATGQEVAVAAFLREMWAEVRAWLDDIGVDPQPLKAWIDQRVALFALACRVRIAAMEGAGRERGDG